MVAPLVSIALCTYNGAKYLREQMDTLVAQTYDNMEIVVVDDRSSDDTIAILNDYASRFPNIRIYQNAENLGYIKNFEKAIGLCQGEYIALADQDDIWDLNKISILVENIGEHLLISHDSAFMDEQGNPMGRKMSDIRNFYAGGDSRIFLMENYISGHAMLFRRSLLEFFTGFNPVIMHDWWLAYIACNNGTITFVDRVLVNYRQHQNANTNILRQERGQEKQKESLIKIERQLRVTTQFAEYPYNRDTYFKQKLLNLMQKRMNNYFSLDLAWFVYVNRKTILYIQKKSALSKLNFILKFAWGYKFKQLFN